MSKASVVAERAVVSVILLFALVYIGDYLLVRWKMAHPQNGPAFGTVHMYRLLAIPLKDGKTEYEFVLLPGERDVNASGQHSARVSRVNAK